MAIVRRYGKPQFLITMMANGNWNEIRQQLEKGQSYADRPDIVARVFEQKKKALINDLKSGILGKFVSIVGVVEFVNFYSNLSKSWCDCCVGRAVAGT